MGLNGRWEDSLFTSWLHNTYNIRAAVHCVPRRSAIRATIATNPLPAPYAAHIDKTNYHNMILEARCDTRPPPTPTFTFRVFFNFHLENKVIYMSGSRRRRLAHTCLGAMRSAMLLRLRTKRVGAAHCGALNALTFEGPLSIVCRAAEGGTVTHLFWATFYGAHCIGN